MSTSGYRTYVLSQQSRAALAALFEPKYSKFIGHHITYQFGVAEDAPLPPTPKSVKVIGYIDSSDGLEALVVNIDGTTDRLDGSTYHITWSLEPELYSAKQSNDLLKSKRYTLILPINIKVIPSK